jgi:hypothetical protein
VILVTGDPTWLATADLDGDDRADFLLGPGSSNGIDLLLSR